MLIETVSERQRLNRLEPVELAESDAQEFAGDDLLAGLGAADFAYSSDGDEEHGQDAAIIAVDSADVFMAHDAGDVEDGTIRDFALLS